MWKKEVFAPGFSPDVESLTATSSSFYVMDNTGEVYASSDLSTWSTTGEKWKTILGGYGDGILGIKTTGSDYMHVQYPVPEGYSEMPVSDDFPIYDTSRLGIIETDWAEKPMAIICGGMTAGGELSSNVWAYDGSRWAIINEGYLPALNRPMLTRYVVYRDTPYIFTKREFDVWLLFGGYTEEEEMNRTMYMSYDNGVHWSLAPEAMQLPEFLPSLSSADIIVAGYELTADLSEAWAIPPSTKTRSSYTIDGYDITWICPYLYIIGGYTPYPNSALNTEIWRGVLERLKFTPQI